VVEGGQGGIEGADGIGLLIRAVWWKGGAGGRIEAVGEGLEDLFGAGGVHGCVTSTANIWVEPVALMCNAYTL
jgi:hypothetical protein